MKTVSTVEEESIVIDHRFSAHLINPKAPIFSISIIAKILEVHQRTLRIYDEEGLLVPQRTKTNRRLYSLEDVEKGKVIVHLTRALGINLAGVRLIFHFMEQLNVAPDNYVTYLSEVANALNITPEQQAIKKEQLSKRGRKPKNAKSN